MHRASYRTHAMFALVASTALVAGCGGGSHSSSSLLPTTPLKSGKANVTFVINAPQQSSTESAHGVRPQYLSPATQSMTIDITSGGTTVVDETVGLTLSSSGCSSTLASIVCTLTVPLAACPSPPNDCYTASLTTYDQTGGTGNVLSSAQSIAFTVVSGQSNTVPLTLSGIPASTLVVPTDAWSTGSLTGGYDLLGQGAHNFLIESLDADGNVIVGSGAPAYTIGSPSGSLAVTLSTPLSSSPDAFTVTPPAAFSSSGASFTVTPTTDGCSQSGANCNPVTVTVDMQPLLFVADTSSNIVAAYAPPYTGTPIATISTDVSGPGGVAFDASDNLFVANFSSSTVTEYAPPYTGAPIMTIRTDVSNPAAIAFDASDDLFVANFSSITVTEYTPPYSSSPVATITNHTSSPEGVAVYSGELFVSSSFGVSGAVAEYAPPYNSSPAVTITDGISSPKGLAVDSSGNLFVGNQAGNVDPSVTEYAPPYTTGPVATITADVSYATGIALDSAGNLFVTSPYTNAVWEYAPPYTGAPASVAPGSSNPNGLAVDE